MKQFFKMMFASTLGVFIALGIFFFLSIFTLIGVVGSFGGSSIYTPSSNTVYKISLDGSITDVATDNPFAGLLNDSKKAISLKTLLETIETAKENENIKGIYLEVGSLSTGTANLQAIRRALVDFKESGKFIVSYADSYGQGSYYLCSVADKVFMNPKGGLSLVGMASQTMFYKGLMEKIGVEMEIFKVGTYKGAVEPFMLNKLSDANREQIESYVGSIWNNITEGIAEGRGIKASDVNHFADEGLAFGDASKAVECGLIDELKYKPEVEEYVKELAGQTEDKLATASYSEVSNIKKLTREKPDKVAILYAEGEIVMSGSSSIYDTNSTITEKLADELRKLKDNDEVKAVVLRVNSPGGSAYVSEQIWKEIVELKKEKPIVVSMGSVAASGGYYISCAADKIVAESNTLTGSIGVFATIPIATEGFKKIGVTADVVKTNRYADLGDMTRPFRADERELVQSFVERTYDLFLTRCADGRSMSNSDIDAIGQGRVWTGEQAIKNGLVDQLGGIETAIEIAAELADLNEYSVTNVTGSKDAWTEFIDKQLGNIKVAVIEEVLGQDFEHYQNLQTIRRSSGVLARMPFDMKPL